MGLGDGWWRGREYGAACLGRWAGLTGERGIGLLVGEGDDRDRSREGALRESGSYKEKRVLACDVYKGLTECGEGLTRTSGGAGFAVAEGLCALSMDSRRSLSNCSS